MRTLITALLFDDELPVKNKPLVVDDEPPAPFFATSMSGAVRKESRF